MPFLLFFYTLQGPNAVFLYELKNVDPSFTGVLPFNVSSNGIITVALSLDYEFITSYKFEVCRILYVSKVVNLSLYMYIIQTESQVFTGFKD